MSEKINELQREEQKLIAILNVCYGKKFPKMSNMFDIDNIQKEILISYYNDRLVFLNDKLSFYADKLDREDYFEKLEYENFMYNFDNDFFDGGF